MTDIVEQVKGLTAASEAKIEDLAQEVKAVSFALRELEQRGARGGVTESPETLGATFLKERGAEIGTLVGQRGRIELNTKATITSATGSGGALIPPARDAGPMLPRRTMTIRDLLSVVEVTSGSVEYPRQLTRSTAAATVAEGALKPEGEMTFDLVTAPIRTIAHWIPASLQVLDDAPQLQSLIDEDLRYGLALQEEAQLLYGSGTGQNLNGMILAATAFAAPSGVGTTNMIDKIGYAILQGALTDVPPDGIIVHPADWWRMRLLKDADGKYLLGDPASDAPPVMFGLPVVATQAIAADTFLVGNFRAQTLYDRWSARVEISTEHSDFFVRNLCAIRAEERIGFAIKRPSALIVGDFGNIT